MKLVRTTRPLWKLIYGIRNINCTLDTHKGRCELLQKDTEHGYLHDALCVGKADTVFSKSTLETFKQDHEGDHRDESFLPLGLQNWDEFGAPPGCPGRSSWHPKKQEHEIIAWMIAMEFVSAMEEAIQLIQKDPMHWAQTFRTHDWPEPTFPNPLSHTDRNDLPNDKRKPGGIPSPNAWTVLATTEKWISSVLNSSQG
jgi:hypothetical protein